MQMKPEEYRRRWKAITAAADANDDMAFWRGYADFLRVTDAISRERLALRKMTRRIVEKLDVLLTAPHSHGK